MIILTHFNLESSSQTKKKKLHKEEEKRMSEEIELQTLLTKLLIDDLEKYALNSLSFTRMYIVSSAPSVVVSIVPWL